MLQIFPGSIEYRILFFCSYLFCFVYSLLSGKTVGKNTFNPLKVLETSDLYFRKITSLTKGIEEGEGCREQRGAQAWKVNKTLRKRMHLCKRERMRPVKGHGQRD